MEGILSTILIYVFIGFIFEGVRKVYFNPFGMVMLIIGTFIILCGTSKSLSKYKTANNFWFFFAVASILAPFFVALANNDKGTGHISFGAMVIIAIGILVGYLCFASIYTSAWKPTFEAEQKTEEEKNGSAKAKGSGKAYSGESDKLELEKEYEDFHRDYSARNMQQPYAQVLEDDLVITVVFFGMEECSEEYVCEFENVKQGDKVLVRLSDNIEPCVAVVKSVSKRSSTLTKKLRKVLAMCTESGIPLYTNRTLLLFIDYANSSVLYDSSDMSITKGDFVKICDKAGVTRTALVMNAHSGLHYDYTPLITGRATEEEQNEWIAMIKRSDKWKSNYTLKSFFEPFEPSV